MTLPNNYHKVLDKGYVGLVSTMGTDLDVVNAARVSYDKRIEGEIREQDKKLLNFLWKNEHTSPFRHATLKFEIYAPLMVARQHWKYAVASTFVDDANGWNESSRRYITEVPEFYIPTADEWRSAPEDSKQGSGEPINYGLGVELSAMLFNSVEACEANYDHALKVGVAPEQARLFLPAYGMYVRYMWTTSLHTVMHFVSQRVKDDAQYEIKEYGLSVKKLASQAFPLSLGLIEK
jgi:thymidylate synthase (FAD)